MSLVLTPNGEGLATATSLDEALQPLVEWDVLCIVTRRVPIVVLAATEQEALFKAMKQPGVIWPIGSRRKTPQAANDATRH